MRMRENLIELYTVFYNNQPLLKLLYYPSTSYYDDPLTKPNITDQNIKKDLVKRSIVVDDLTVERNKGRVLVYPDGRFNASHNYGLADQIVNIDIFVPIKMDEVDFRLAWICDHVNSLLHNERITGVGKIVFRGGRPIIKAVKDYIGYQLSYEFGSAKK